MKKSHSYTTVEMTDNRTAAVDGPPRMTAWTPPPTITAVCHNVAFMPLLRILSHAPDEEEDTSITPLHAAAKEGNLTLVKELMSKGANIRARTLTDDQTPFHTAVRYGMIDVVEYLLKLDSSLLQDVDSVKLTPLHLAALMGHIAIAALLIEHGANISARTSLWTGCYTPIEVATKAGNVAIVECLLNSGASLGEDLDGTKYRYSLLHLASQFGHVDCVQLLLKWGADILRTTCSGLSCLDLAIDNDRRSLVQSLLESEKWVKLMTHAHFADGALVTPMRKLIRKMPDIAEEVFDKCIESGENVEAYSYELLEDQALVEDWLDDSVKEEELEAYTKNKFKVMKNHPLCIMVDGEREQLLSHPLVTSLLKYKWRHIGRYFYHANLLMHIVFIIFLTSYAMMVPSPYEIATDKFNDSYPFDTTVNVSCAAQEYYAQKAENRPSDSELMFAQTCVVICLFIITGMASIEILKLIRTKLGYFTFERLPKWTLFVAAVMFLIPAPCTYYKQRWQWPAGAAAVFLAWMGFTLSLRRFYKIGIYIVMFVHTLKTSMKVVLALLSLAIGFALSFNMLLANQRPFHSPWNSMLKILMWMTGEYEFDSVFNGEPQPELYYPLATNFLFLIFVVFMSILFMNLLVALAIDDIKEIQNRAELTIKAMQIDLALSIEAMLPTRFTKKFIYSGDIQAKVHASVKSQVFDNKEMIRTHNRLYDHVSQLQKDNARLLRKQEKMEDMMEHMSDENRELKSMMHKLLSHNGIDDKYESDV